MINELHLLEQMSSDEHLGSLAEAVLEAVRENPDVGAKVGLFFLVLNAYFLCCHVICMTLGISKTEVSKKLVCVCELLT